MPQFLRKKETGELFARTELLARRPDMEPAEAPESPPAGSGARGDLETMSRGELLVYAREALALDLNPRKSTAEFRARIAARERRTGGGGRP